MLTVTDNVEISKALYFFIYIFIHFSEFLFWTGIISRIINTTKYINLFLKRKWILHDHLPTFLHFHLLIITGRLYPQRFSEL